MAHGPTVTQPETAKMIRMYYDGHQVKDIAARLGRCDDTVRRHLEAAGHFYPRPKRRLDSHEVASVIDWYQRGVRVRDIMARFGIVSAPMIYRHL